MGRRKEGARGSRRENEKAVVRREHERDSNFEQYGEMSDGDRVGGNSACLVKGGRRWFNESLVQQSLKPDHWVKDELGWKKGEITKRGREGQGGLL